MCLSGPLKLKKILTTGNSVIGSIQLKFDNDFDSPCIDSGYKGPMTESIFEAKDKAIESLIARIGVSVLY